MCSLGLLQNLLRNRVDTLCRLRDEFTPTQGVRKKKIKDMMLFFSNKISRTPPSPSPAKLGNSGSIQSSEHGPGPWDSVGAVLAGTIKANLLFYTSIHLLAIKFT